MTVCHMEDFSKVKFSQGTQHNESQEENPSKGGERERERAQATYKTNSNEINLI